MSDDDSNKRSPDDPVEKPDAHPDKHRGRRKLAEWVTLGFSALLVLLTAGYLIYVALQESPDHVPVEVNVLRDEAQQRGDQYIVPVEVRNRGRRTIKDLKLHVTYNSPAGEQVGIDLLVDYLAEHGSQRLYLYLDRPPTGADVKARAVGYQLE